MRERIEQLASGKLDLPLPDLEILVPDIEETIAYGQNFRGDIRITSGNGLKFRGLIYSDDSRVTLLKNTYAGLSTYIQYEVNAEQMEPGSELTGAFSLVWNGGERRVPYRFRIRQTSVSEDRPETLADFAYLAKTDPQAASALFFSRDFSRLPFMEDIHLAAIYDGLNRGPGRRAAMEEFLVGTGAKEKVALEVSGDGFEIITEGHEIRREITLKRSGWGGTTVNVTADRDWIRIPKNTFTDADFNGTECRIPFSVSDEGLHAGKNIGAIRVTTDHDSFVIPVSAGRHVRVGEDGNTAMRSKKSRVEFLNTLLTLLSGTGKKEELIERLQHLWEDMTGDAEPGSIEKLYRAAISLWKEDREVALLILEDAEREIQAARREDPDAYCAFLYLEALATESWEKKETLIKILRHFGELNKETLFMFLLLLHLDEGMNSRPRECLAELENYYRRGSRSPFLYLEAVRIYNRHPDIIRGLDDFTCQAVADGARRGFILPETAGYIASMAMNTAADTAELIRIMKLLYENVKSDEVLSAICALLIKAEIRDPAEFTWYKLGVEHDIRLTRLYDYYLYTAPRDHKEPLPREIVLYFSYNSPRDPSSQALLYNDLFEHYEKDRQIMDAYREPMRNFVRTSVLSGWTDREMAFLYERLLETDDINERSAAVLPDILNAREIWCDDPSYQEAVIAYGETDAEYSARLVNGTAVLPVYSDRAVLLFVDADGNRRSGDIRTARVLMEHTKTLEARCFELSPKHHMLRIKECLKILASDRRSEADIRLLRKELDYEGGLTKAFRRELTKAIVDSAIRRSEPREEELLSCVRYSGVRREQRLKLTELLIRMNRLSEAAGQINRVGYRELPIMSLKSFAEHSIQSGFFTKDELLVDLCRYLFMQGQATDLILEYLCTHYNAASADMQPVLLAASEKNVNLSDMAERLLAQMLFSGERAGMDDVFRIYMRQENTEPLLLKAYYVTKCAGYFRQDEPAGEYVFRYAEVCTEKTEKDDASDIMELALVKYYAMKDALLPEESGLCMRLMDRFYREGRIFSFMKKLAGKIRLPEEIRHREIIEYHGRADRHLTVTMTLLPDRKDRTPLRMMIPEVFPGIYVKPVLLFEGDELLYEITDESGDTAAAGSIRGTASDAKDRSRFAELNRLQNTVRSGRYVQEWQQRVMDYAARDTWVTEMFSLSE